MLRRLRLILLALATTIAVVTTTFVAAPSAHADPTGTTCMDPTIEGSIVKTTVTNSMGLQVVVVKFSAVGFTSANCPTSFTNYRYKAAFTYKGHTTSAYESSIEPAYGPSPSGMGLTRVGTRIEFPDQTLSYQGPGPVNLAVTAGSKSVFSSTWCRSNEETWDYQLWVLPSQTFNYDTATVDGTPRGKINACP